MIYKELNLDTGEIEFKLKLENRITLIMDNGSGLTKILFETIKMHSLLDIKDVIHLSRHDMKCGDISFIEMALKLFKNKLIVIYDADIILNSDLRHYISEDKDTQYIIFTNDYSGFNKEDFKFTMLNFNNKVKMKNYN